MFDKYLYFHTVYCNVFDSTNDHRMHWPDAAKQPKLFEAVEKVQGISSPEELGIQLALNPLQARDMLFAAWTSGYSNAVHFSKGKTYEALHELCLQDPACAAEAFQDPDFPDLVKLTFTERYFDPWNGLF